MSEIGGEIVIILLLIVANGVFAMSEMAVITARKSRLQDWIRRVITAPKSPSSWHWRRIDFSPRCRSVSPWSAFWLAHSPAEASPNGSLPISKMPSYRPYHQEIGLGLVVLIITYFSLVIGELVPKRLALRHPESDRDVCRPTSAVVYPCVVADGSFTWFVD